MLIKKIVILCFILIVSNCQAQSTTLTDADMFHNSALKAKSMQIANLMVYQSFLPDFREFKDIQNPIPTIEYSITLIFQSIRSFASPVASKKTFENYLNREEHFKTFIRETIINENDYNRIITKLETARKSFQEDCKSIENQQNSGKNLLLITAFSIILIESFVIIRLCKMNLSLQSTLKLCEMLITEMAKHMPQQPND